MRPQDLAFIEFSDGSTTNMAIDGTAATGTPTMYKVTAPGSGSLVVSRINFQIVDGSMTYGKFGGLTALTNGITIKAYDSGDNVLCDFTPSPIKANEHWCKLAGIDAIAEPAAGDDFMPVRWTLTKAVPSYDNLDNGIELAPGDYIGIYISDDLSGLTYFQGMLQGVYR